MLAQIEKKNAELSQESIHAAWRLKGDYEKLQKEMKEELAKELEDFYKKFNDKIVEFDLSPDDQILIKDYFEAFIGTFSSVFDASRAIESERFQLNIGCLLSTFASFVSFIDDDLPKEITSIEKFLSIKEMKTNAKKMLKLFSDSTYLNAVIGKIAEKIVMSQTKREEILSVTEKELDYLNRDLTEKMSKFCEQISENVEIDFYRKLYNTPAARLGHMDANDLIQEYLEGKIRSKRVQEEFVERTLKRQRETYDEEEASPPTTPALDQNEKENVKGKCCSIF